MAVRTVEHNAKIGATLRGRVFSAETRAKMSIAAEKRQTSDETRAKMSAAHMGYIASVETRAKLSVASTTHGMKASRIYGVWAAMLRRCTNPNVKSWKYYVVGVLRFVIVGERSPTSSPIWANRLRD